MTGRHAPSVRSRRPLGVVAVGGGLAAVVAVIAITVHALGAVGPALPTSAPVPTAGRSPRPGPPTPVPTPSGGQVTPAPSTGTSTGTSPGTTPRPTPTAPPARSPRSRERAVRRAVAAALHGRHGVADLAITDVTGRQVVHAGAGTPVRTASIVKLLVLRAVQARGPLSRTERTLATRMITRSDNDATTRLWKASGRDAGIARAAAALGMTHTTRIPVLLLPWDGWQTTAEDQVRLLHAIGTGRDAGSRFTRSLMAHVIASQRWGVGSVAGATGVKNGWLPVRGRWIVNTDGCATRHGVRLCMSVLSTGSRSFAEGIRTVELAAAAAVRAWAG